MGEREINEGNFKPLEEGKEVSKENISPGISGDLDESERTEDLLFGKRTFGEREKSAKEHLAADLQADYQEIEQKSGDGVIKIKKREELPTIEEIITKNQAIYDFLEIGVDLNKEYDDNHIVIPTDEERAEAGKLGYPLELIIPMHLRDQILTQAEEKLRGIYLSCGVRFRGDQIYRDIQKTDAAIKSKFLTLPKFYAIMLKPDQDVKDAHPQTVINPHVTHLLMDVREQWKQLKSPNELTELLNNLQQGDPNIHFRGLNLPEYLLAQICFYLQTRKQGNERPELVDPENRTLLLEEVIRNRENQPLKYLLVGWDKYDQAVAMRSLKAVEPQPYMGIRFGIVPKKLINSKSTARN